MLRGFLTEFHNGCKYAIIKNAPGFFPEPERRCCIVRSAHFLADFIRGEVVADGKRTLGESPAFHDMPGLYPLGIDLHIPESVLTAWLEPKRSTGLDS